MYLWRRLHWEGLQCIWPYSRPPASRRSWEVQRFPTHSVTQGLGFCWTSVSLPVFGMKLFNGLIRFQLASALLWFRNITRNCVWKSNPSSGLSVCLQLFFVTFLEYLTSGVPHAVRSCGNLSHVGAMKKCTNDKCMFFVLCLSVYRSEWYKYHHWLNSGSDTVGSYSIGRNRLGLQVRHPQLLQKKQFEYYCPPSLLISVAKEHNSYFLLFQQPWFWKYFSHFFCKGF